METNKPLPGSKSLDLKIEHLKSENDGVFKDFLRLKDAFSAEIDMKEKNRLSLMENIKKLELNIIDGSKKIDVLGKNIQIYKKNINEIGIRLANLTRRENWIKKNYSDIVSGSVNNPQKLLNTNNPDTLSNTFYNLFKENMKVHERQVKSKLEELQSQKEKFLETLKNLFEHYDKELATISKEKDQLNELHEEIEAKEKNAVQLKKKLNHNTKIMEDQILKDRTELEITFDEEERLIKEFQKIIQGVKADIKVSDITRNFLFSSVNSSEKQNCFEEESNK